MVLQLLPKFSKLLRYIEYVFFILFLSWTEASRSIISMIFFHLVNLHWYTLKFCLCLYHVSMSVPLLSIAFFIPKESLNKLLKHNSCVAYYLRIIVPVDFFLPQSRRLHIWHYPQFLGGIIFSFCKAILFNSLHYIIIFIQAHIFGISFASSTNSYFPKISFTYYTSRFSVDRN